MPALGDWRDLRLRIQMAGSHEAPNESTGRAQGRPGSQQQEWECGRVKVSSNQKSLRSVEIGSRARLAPGLSKLPLPTLGIPT